MATIEAPKPPTLHPSLSLRDRFALRRLDIVIIIILALLIGVRIYQRGKHNQEGILGRPLRVGIVAWPGYAGGLVANNGLEPNKDSHYWNKYNLLVEFVEIKGEAELREQFLNRKIDIMWSTVDSLALQAPALQSAQPRAFMQVDWSRGGDAIIASAEIKQIEGLKGKRIAVSMAASQWLFESSLENSSRLDDNDRTAIRQRRVLTKDSHEAGVLFAHNDVDAAVLWEPDVTQAIRDRVGAHRLLDTSTATNLIADVMVARADFIKAHPAVIKAFIEGWLVFGTPEALKDPMLAVRVLQNEEAFEKLGETETQKLLGTVKWATLNDDNDEMFGLSGGEPFFDKLFNRANHLWLKHGYLTDSVTAKSAYDVDLLREVWSAHQPPDQAKCGAETPLDVITLELMFPPGKTDLVDQAKSILNNQDALFTLQTHTGARFCVQAKASPSDDPQHSVETNQSREKAVIDYLVEHYRRPRSQFVSANANPPEPSNPVNTQYIRLNLSVVGSPSTSAGQSQTGKR